MSCPSILFFAQSTVTAAEVVPAWSTHVGNNTVLEDDVVFLHKQEELAVARGLGQKPVAQVCCTGLHCAAKTVAHSACHFMGPACTWLAGGRSMLPQWHHLLPMP